jgi:hypothetical protein
MRLVSEMVRPAVVRFLVLGAADQVTELRKLCQ